MKRHSFHAMGTEWLVISEIGAPMAQVESLVHAAEARLSRFAPTSALSTLNRDRCIHDATLAEIVTDALRMRELTGGAFDPTLGNQLSALGYDRTFEAIDRPLHTSRPRSELAVEVVGDRVELCGEGDLDLGGIAKGWTVDQAVRLLVGAGSQRALVDGGGDIRVIGDGWLIGVGEELVVDLANEAIATSSTRCRRWVSADGSPFHHIIDPRTGCSSAASLDTVSVVALRTFEADALATAVVVDPDPLLEALPTMGARAAVRATDETWWTTPNWESRQ